MKIPSEHIIKSKDKIAPFNGERWPYSNAKPAVYSAAGLFYGKTMNRDENGALINNDIEYSIQNVLNGCAFGLFYTSPDNSLSMEGYGLSSIRLDKNVCNSKNIISIIEEQTYKGILIHINEAESPLEYLVWGYKDNGKILLGHKFEEGNDDLNCSIDFEKPYEYKSMEIVFDDHESSDPEKKKTNEIEFIQPTGEMRDKIAVYKEALLRGYNMMIQNDPPQSMDHKNIRLGYGQSVYEEWIHQLELANEEKSDNFYYASPVFPHFIAFYENRLHLYKFLKVFTQLKDDKNLQKATELSEQLKDIAQKGAQITFDNEWTDPKILSMTNNERRVLLIDILKKCRKLEIEITECIKSFFDLYKKYTV